ncbi:MAG: hypothetical protein QOJ59_1033 [Thermomicrobiales bacterium]|nr:hypothetical protein [Thermomicrobiales bacterium]
MIGVVTTTIFDMPALDTYVESVLTFGREREVKFYIIPDRKTPPQLLQRIDGLRMRGVQIAYPDLLEQDAFLHRIGLPSDFIPYDTDNRRNIGFLMAFADGAEVLISIDDDNFCRSGEDFVGEHYARLNTDVNQGILLQSPTGWVNVMDFIDYEPSAPAWARGFPYSDRNPVEYEALDGAAVGRVSVHAGLWSHDPDVDAVTRLAVSPFVRGAKNNAWYILGRESWMPINTQNTGLTRDSAQAYYYVRMGFPFGELRLDRFGDILSGYFVEACAKAAGDLVSFGLPIVDHHRTKHDLLKDLGFEYFGILLIEELVPWLRSVRLTGGTYIERYRNLAAELREFAATHSGPRWKDGMGNFLDETAALMSTWASAVERL